MLLFLAASPGLLMHQPKLGLLRQTSPMLRTSALVSTVAVEAPPKAAGVPYSSLTVGVIKETADLEQRCAQSPESVGSLTKAGFNVLVQSGAGAAAGFTDSAYEDKGAKVVPEGEAWKSDIVLKLQPPTAEQAAKVGDRTLVSLLNPVKNEALIDQMGKQGATVFALDCIPRMLSRGQAFDVLSSQTNIIGYRAVVEAQHAFGRFFAGQMTAAGKVAPARVLVLGAGVSGLAAIQAAKNAGADVRAYDVRPAVKEQVESLGGKFLKVPYEEDGSGSGGYAKEMSDEYVARAFSRLLSPSLAFSRPPSPSPDFSHPRSSSLALSHPRSPSLALSYPRSPSLAFSRAFRYKAAEQKMLSAELVDADVSTSSPPLSPPCISSAPSSLLS